MSEIHQQQGTMIRYDAMVTAIAECLQVDEVKGIRDRAKALEEYSRQAQNRDAEKQCAEIRIRAERKAGQLIKRMERIPGKRTDKTSTQESTSPRSENERSGQTFSQQIEQANISQQQARDWQDLANVPEEKFEQSLAQPGVPTTGGIISAANPQPATIEPQSGWLYAWLLDFEKQALLDRDAVQLVAELSPIQQTRVKSLAPSISDWLWNLQPNENS